MDKSSPASQIGRDQIKETIERELAAAKQSVSPWRRFLNNWPRRLAFIADIVALSFLFYNANQSPDVLLKVVLVLLSVMCIVFLALFVHQQWSSSSKEGYAEATIAFHAAMHRLRDIHHWLRKQDRVDEDKLGLFKAELANVLTPIALAFSLITGTRCRACIKTFVVPQDQFDPSRDDMENARIIKTITFCRDRDSWDVNGFDVNIEPAPIADNSSFRFLWEGKPSPKNRWYFSPDLRKIYPKNYQNTSFDYYGIPGLVTSFGFWKQWQWTLPYRSCIVWPIRILPPEGTARADQLHRHQHILGFLAVDSYGVNIFHRHYDTQIGAAFADALFALMRDFANIKKDLR